MTSEFLIVEAKQGHRDSRDGSASEVPPRTELGYIDVQRCERHPCPLIGSGAWLDGGVRGRFRWVIGERIELVDHDHPPRRRGIGSDDNVYPCRLNSDARRHRGCTARIDCAVVTA